MDINIAAQFTKLFGIKVDELLGSIVVQIDPGSLCIFDENTPSNGLHFHNCYEMCLVTGGAGEFIHGGESYILKEGDIFIANPGIAHEIRLLREKGSKYSGSLHLVFFRIFLLSNNDSVPKLYEERMLREFLSAHAIISHTQHQLFSYLYFIEKYTSYNCKENYGLYQVVKNLALLGLFSLVGACKDRFDRHAPETIIDLAINYIGANLHRRIYIYEIAASACTSVRNLQHVFQKQLNRSIVNYINQRKAAIAAGYLKMNFKVSDVCVIIGINDSAQFTRMFKKYLGMPPKEYQLKYSPGGMISGAEFLNF